MHRGTQQAFARRSLVALCLLACSSSREADSCVPTGSGCPSSAAASGGKAGSPGGSGGASGGTKFDFTGPDLVQHNRPAEQSEIGPPKSFPGCGQCEGETFCDRDRCAAKGRGGIGYAGGMLGWTCYSEPDDPQIQFDPKLATACNGHVCQMDVCVSCRIDADCCLSPLGASPVCRPGANGTSVCLWWERIQSNYCFSTQFLRSRGITF